MITPEFEFLTHCTRDEAIAIIAGLIQRPLQVLPPTNFEVSHDEMNFIESIKYCLRDDLQDNNDSLVGDLAEARFDNLPENIIAEKQAALAQFKDQVRDVEIISLYIDDEIAKLTKGESSPLRIHPQATAISGVERYTIISVKDCEQKIRTSILESNNSKSKNIPTSQNSLSTDENPWNVVDPCDPPTTIHWYTAARYFARQLVKDNTKLLTNKNLLAQKVELSLKNACIHDRSGKKPPSYATIRKAFIKVKLG